MNLKLLLILILSSLAVLFIAQNVAVVEVAFLSWRISMSSALLIFFTLALGFLFGWFFHGYLSYRESRRKTTNLR